MTLANLVLLLALAGVSVVAYNEREEREEIIEALKECENESVLDKILKKYREKKEAELNEDAHSE